MKTIDDINLYTWFSERELNFAPEHFVSSKTSLTDESKAWILEKLTGRFAVIPNQNFFTAGNTEVAFEDPKEALFYELTWG
jgi:hypothetical protein